MSFSARNRSDEEMRGRNPKRESIMSVKEAELRASAAGVVNAIGGKGKVEVPRRSSSYGKGSPARGMAIVTHTAPMRIASPLASPGFAPPEIAEDYNPDEAAPAPGVRKGDSMREKENKIKRGSKSFRASDSGVLSKRRSIDFLTSNSTPKRRSEPPTAQHPSQTVPNPGLGLFPPTKTSPSSPSRPSFQSSERPSSADSIDDAVDSYLCSPRLSQKLRMPNTGRTISFSEVGDPTGFAVFVCVGMGLTRYVTAFYDELALTLGLRLITPDRPGVGESDPIEEAERTVLNWPDDVLYICQSLKITKFSILAHSAGAIYALATALRMPGHIRGKIHLLAPWIPPSQMEGVVGAKVVVGQSKVDGKEEKVRVGGIPASQRFLRSLPTPILKAANSSFMSATSSSLTTSLPRTSTAKRKKRSTTPGPPKKSNPDQPSVASTPPVPALPTDLGDSPAIPRPKTSSLTLNSLSKRHSDPALPTKDAEQVAAEAAYLAERQAIYDERLTSSIWALSTRNANPAVDLLVCLERNRPVGFRYVDITREVVIHHGAKDTRVPVENVRWLGGTMRKAEVRVLQEEGHGLMASAKVMGGVLEEVAGEWRDWRRVCEKGGRQWAA